MSSAKATVLLLSSPELTAQTLAEFALEPNYQVTRETPQRYLLKKTTLTPEGKKTQTDYRIQAAFSIANALDLLHYHYFNIMLIDTRYFVPEPPLVPCDPSLYTVLESLNQTSGMPLYRADRIIALADERGDLLRRSFILGSFRLGGIVVAPARNDALCQEIDRLLRLRPSNNKTALCLAGGGVEGLLWELGVLRALNSYFENCRVTDFDLYFGISAGAYIAAILANNIQPEELIAAFENQSHVLDHLNSKIIYDLNYPEFIQRAMILLRQLLRTRKSYGRLVASLIKSIPSGLCRGDRLEAYMQRQFQRLDVPDDFRELKKKLYIGATDQDTAEPVVFGDQGFRDVRISEAVHASAALVPFYRPKEINGRYYVDGAYTRTTNFQLAIEKGAKLIVILDPLVPLSINRPGYVLQRGGVFGSIQGIKSMSHSRFTRAFESALRTYPEITFVLIRPEAKDMRIMSGSPMKYKIRKETQKLGFEAAERKIHQNFIQLQGALRKFGFEISEDRITRECEDLARADADDINHFMCQSPHNNPIVNDARRWLKELETYLGEVGRGQEERLDHGHSL